MTDLFWPGDHRAGDADERRARSWRPWSRSKHAWLDALDRGRDRAGRRARRPDRAGRHDGDVEAIAARRRRRRQPGQRPRRAAAATRAGAPTARWLHRGLTSQDVVDTALMLCAARRARPASATSSPRRSHPRHTGRSPPGHTDAGPHPDSGRAAEHGRREGRRLAVGCPGRRRAGRRSSLPVQVGGAAGTLAAAAELAGSVDARDRTERRRWPPRCGWRPRHRGTQRGRPSPASATRWSPAATRGATSPTTCSPAAGPRSASWPRASGGGSSTMPHKSNPVRSVLIRRAALTAGPLGATLHTASACQRRRTLRRRMACRMGDPAHPGPAHRCRRVPDVRTAGRTAGRRRRAPPPTSPRPSGVLSEQQTMAELTGAHRDSGLHSGPPNSSSTPRCSAPATTSRTHHEHSVLAVTDFGGPADAGLLVLGPSLGTSADTLWSEAAAQLSEHVRVVGLGPAGPRSRRKSRSRSPSPSSPPACWHSPTTSRDEPFHYAGDSVGGCVGLQLLLDAPHRVSSATLLCTGGGDRHPGRLA